MLYTYVSYVTQWYEIYGPKMYVFSLDLDCFGLIFERRHC